MKVLQIQLFRNTIIDFLHQIMALEILSSPVIEHPFGRELEQFGVGDCIGERDLITQTQFRPCAACVAIEGDGALLLWLSRESFVEIFSRGARRDERLPRRL